MARFFIDRPIFAWVLALFISVLGLVAIQQLPISQYPPVAPPSVVISAAYPGASAQTLEDSVLAVIEREMNGSPGMIYMESVAQADGTGEYAGHAQDDEPFEQSQQQTHRVDPGARRRRARTSGGVYAAVSRLPRLRARSALRSGRRGHHPVVASTARAGRGGEIAGRCCKEL